MAVETTFDFGGEESPVDRLAAIARAKAEIAREEAAAVRYARVHGLSWAEIGTVLGVSRQALHKRFGRTA